jgi:hypothetical protein
MNELKSLLNVEFQSPTEGFVRHFAKQIYQGVLTAKVMELFNGLTKKSIQQYINDLITERLKSALKKENEADQKPVEKESVAALTDLKDNKIETTEEEREGFMIVKTILRQKIKASRIVYRDAQSYFAVLLDDNNRKTICRLYMNGAKRYMGTFDEQKKETRNEILTVDDIFKFADILQKTVANFDGEKTESGTEKIKVVE